MRKKVIILGGSSGIGKSTAERFAKEGWKVFIADQAQSEQTMKGLSGTGHIFLETDVRKNEQIERMRKIVEESFVNFDVLVNSVGVSQSSGALESDFDHWDNPLQVMLYGTVKTSRALVPLMADGGRIIYITSIHHCRVGKGSSAYGMAKSPVTQFARSFALELAPRNILVMQLLPDLLTLPCLLKKMEKMKLTANGLKTTT